MIGIRMSKVLGIEIGGTKLQIVAGDEAANILARERFSVAPGSGADGILLVGVVKPNYLVLGYFL